MKKIIIPCVILCAALFINLFFQKAIAQLQHSVVSPTSGSVVEGSTDFKITVFGGTGAYKPQNMKVHLFGTEGATASINIPLNTDYGNQWIFQRENVGLSNMPNQSITFYFTYDLVYIPTGATINTAYTSVGSFYNLSHRCGHYMSSIFEDNGTVSWKNSPCNTDYITDDNNTPITFPAGNHYFDDRHAFDRVTFYRPLHLAPGANVFFNLGDDGWVDFVKEVRLGEGARLTINSRSVAFVGKIETNEGNIRVSCPGDDATIAVYGDIVLNNSSFLEFRSDRIYLNPEYNYEQRANFHVRNHSAASFLFCNHMNVVQYDIKAGGSSDIEFMGYGKRNYGSIFEIGNCAITEEDWNSSVSTEANRLEAHIDLQMKLKTAWSFRKAAANIPLDFVKGIFKNTFALRYYHNAAPIRIPSYNLGATNLSDLGHSMSGDMAKLIIARLENPQTLDCSQVQGYFPAPFNYDGNYSNIAGFTNDRENKEVGKQVTDHKGLSLSKSTSVYPNPFTKETTIQYYLPEEEQLSFSVMNTQGNIVYSFSKIHKQGSHQFTWNGKNQFGSKLPPGIYYVKLHSSSLHTTMKVVLL